MTKTRMITMISGVGALISGFAIIISTVRPLPVLGSTTAWNLPYGTTLSGKFGHIRKVADLVRKQLDWEKKERGLMTLCGRARPSLSRVLIPKVRDLGSKAYNANSLQLVGSGTGLKRWFRPQAPKYLGPMPRIRSWHQNGQIRAQYGYGEDQVDLVISVASKNRMAFSALLMPIYHHPLFRGITDGMASALFFPRGPYCVGLVANRPLDLLVRWAEETSWFQAPVHQYRIRAGPMTRMEVSVICPTS